MENAPVSGKQDCITHFVRGLNRKLKNENLQKMRNWQARKDKIEQNNADLKVQNVIMNAILIPHYQQNGAAVASVISG